MEMLQLTVFVVLFVCPVFGRSFIKDIEQQHKDVANRQIVLQRAKRGDATSLSRVKRTDIFELALEQQNAPGGFDEDNTVSRQRRSVQEEPIIDSGNFKENSVIQRTIPADETVLSRVKRRN
ncbi:uncharacterized protein LOC128547668 [Mercenaria mercenaria]|uniref:uncharacterized protein LOC128547668 n=1 Tax=Mercenaria mercenaria TaxID=6596 RepID=UPI00234E73D5|nr:uncharacterized protein LOC128547668 [Mercenaria mercenaria]